LLPVPLLTVRLTEYVPAFRYTYNGLCAMDVPPSPNVHDQDVTGPVDASVNYTASGLFPDVGLPVKLAVTGPGGTGVVVVVTGVVVVVTGRPPDGIFSKCADDSMRAPFPPVYMI